MLGRPPLSLAMCAFRPTDGAAGRSGIERAASAGYRWVHLDAAAPGLRARELSRSARRDLAALLRRSELGLSGLDLWVPAEHFAVSEHADRAVAAVTQAIALAADLSTLTGSPGRTVCLRLPESTVEGAERSLLDAAERFEVRLADHTLPPRGAESSGGRLGLGIDPAAALLAGQEPGRLAARAGDRLACARLSDLDAGGGRVLPGRGRLDLDGYLAAVSIAGWSGPVVLDLRAVPAPERAMEDVIAGWA